MARFFKICALAASGGYKNRHPPRTPGPFFPERRELSRLITSTRASTPDVRRDRSRGDQASKRGETVDAARQTEDRDRLGTNVAGIPQDASQAPTLQM
jgi:hypothetical protein